MMESDHTEDSSLEELNQRITGHKQREAQLTKDLRNQQDLISTLHLAEERSAMLAAIVNSSYDAIISKDLNSIVTSWNPAAERIFGYTANEMIGQSITKLIPPDRIEEEPQILARIRKGEKVDHFETKRLASSGRLIDVSLTISPVMDSSGRIIGVSKIARDITDKKLEEQRKNDFIAFVSHELKTPLTSIRSYVQLALLKSKSHADIFTENVLRRAENQTQKMVSMIHDFLNLSRLENSKMSLHMAHFSLTEFMEEVITEAITLAPAHLVQYESCAEATLYGDREKLSQVMTNLLGNAGKYSPEGTTILLKCQLVGKQVQFNVIDEGMGIAPDDKVHLFERYYRVKDTERSSVKGFGIGLYLVAEILKLHGSEIKVESELGKGSTFSFSLIPAPVLA